MTIAYYSEFDPFAAAWLRKLIAEGHIAPGVVDERDLWDVCPEELRGYTQVHLCAGIGVWSYALRQAGWPDERPVWTASYPCQPFSAAGKGLGFTDDRHLWPAGLHLVRSLRPERMLGEQVASKDGLAWLDLVQSDLEAEGYAFGAVDLCAAGVGAPHIRQRSFWVADSSGERRVGWQGISTGRLDDWENAERIKGDDGSFGIGQASPDGLANGGGARLEGKDARALGYERSATERSVGSGRLEHGPRGGRQEPGRSVAETGVFGGLADTDGRNARTEWQQCGREQRQQQGDSSRGVGLCAPTNGHWRDADWLGCRDGKWRPVESGTFPLAHRASNRVGRLRGYGNAIVAPLAQTFIEAVMEILDDA